MGLVVLVLGGSQVALLRSVTSESFPFAAGPVLAVDVVGLLGFAFYRSIADQAAVSVRLAGTDEVYDAALVVFLVASAALFSGALVAGALGRTRRVTASMRTNVLASRALQSFASSYSFWLLSLGIFAALLTVISVTPQALLSRPAYLDAYGPQTISKLVPLLLPLGLTGTMLVVFDSTRNRWKYLAAIVGSLLIILTFARGTRLLAAVPAVVMFAFWARRPGRKFGPTSLLLVVGATFVCLQLPIALRLRGLSDAGMIPYLNYLASDPGAAFIPDLPALIGNILFSVPLTGTIATQILPMPVHYLITSLNPLPGALTDWDAISPLLRIDYATPFNALGELQNYGTLVLFTYCFVVGLTLTQLQLASRRLSAGRRTLALIFIGSMTLLFSLNLLQYNLRSTTREIWYAVIGYLLIRFLPDVRAKRPGKSGGSIP